MLSYQSIFTINQENFEEENTYKIYWSQWLHVISLTQRDARIWSGIGILRTTSLEIVVILKVVHASKLIDDLILISEKVFILLLKDFVVGRRHILCILSLAKPRRWLAIFCKRWTIIFIELYLATRIIKSTAHLIMIIFAIISIWFRSGIFILVRRLKLIIQQFIFRFKFLYLFSLVDRQLICTCLCLLLEKRQHFKETQCNIIVGVITFLCLLIT